MITVCEILRYRAQVLPFGGFEISQQKAKAFSGTQRQCLASYGPTTTIIPSPLHTWDNANDKENKMSKQQNKRRSLLNVRN